MTENNLPVDEKIFTLQELIKICDEAYQQGRDSMERWHDYIYDEGERFGTRKVVECVNGFMVLHSPRMWQSKLKDWGYDSSVF